MKSVKTQTDHSNGMPDGWRMARFDELAQIINERVNPSKTDAEVYVGLEHLDSDTLKIRRWGTPDDVIGDKLRFQKGDIIFGKRRAYQRKLAVAECNGICSAHAMVVRAKTETVDARFLPIMMQSDSFMKRAVEISVGSLSPTINWKTLRAEEFLLPPKKEQGRIAEILWASEQVCHCSLEILQSLEAAKRSFVKDHFSTLRASICPKGWTRSRLSNLFLNPKDTGHKQIVILSVTIDGRVVTRESLERSVIDRTGTEKYLRVMPNDMVYNTMRMWQGSCGIVDREGLVSPAYTVLRPIDASVSTAYWNLAFHSPWMLDVFTRYSTGVAADRWRLYYRDFGRIEVNVPPVELGRCIERRFAALTSAHEAAAAKLASDRHLRMCIRQELLKE